jgi:hypothetical protein
MYVSVASDGADPSTITVTTLMHMACSQDAHHCGHDQVPMPVMPKDLLLS